MLHSLSWVGFSVNCYCFFLAYFRHRQECLCYL